MGFDWHDAGQENREAAVASLKEQLAEARANPEGLVIGEAKEASTPEDVKRETEAQRWRDLRIRITDGMKMPHFEYIGGLFPRGGVSFLAARAGDCKTWLAQRIAIDLSLGGVVLDGIRYHEPQRRVLYVAGEAHWDLFVRRANYMQWPATQDTLMLYDSREIEKSGLSVMLDTEKEREHVGRLIDETKPDIVFFDSFSDFFFADENKSAEMKPIVRWIESLAQERRIAVVLPHHHSKRKPSERKLDFDQDDLIGSSVLQRLAHLILTMKKSVMADGEEAIYVKCTRSRNRYPFPFAFRVVDEDSLDGDGHRTSMKVFLNPEMGTTKGSKVVELIEASFDVGQWFSKQEAIDLVAGEASVRSIENMLHEMQERGMIVDNGQKTNKLRYARKGHDANEEM
ncbi:MAG: AAA family ATPase [Synergistaceae bacterium]|nr:AAA family ATPase [Synergistaceae bacterium]